MTKCVKMMKKVGGRYGFQIIMVKNRHYIFYLRIVNLQPTLYTSFMDVNGMDILLRRIVCKDTRGDIEIHGRFIVL